MLISKQPYEEFWIGGDFSGELEDLEVLALPGCAVVCYDKDGNNLSGNADTVYDESEPLILSADNTQLKCRIKGGVEALSPYKISFLSVTSAGNRYEIDAEIEVEDL
jgi:hypothetical protein